MANWSGQWPGLVGMLNLNASLTKAGVTYSTLWSEDFTRRVLPERPAQVAGAARRWQHDVSHARALERVPTAGQAEEAGQLAWRRELRRGKAIMGVFDEGCMGMYNAIIPDELLHADGRVQGAAEPVGAVRRDAAGAAMPKRAAVRQLARRQGHEVSSPGRTRKPI